MLPLSAPRSTYFPSSKTFHPSVPWITGASVIQTCRSGPLLVFRFSSRSTREPSASRSTRTEPLLSCSWLISWPRASTTGSVGGAEGAETVGAASFTSTLTNSFHGWNSQSAATNSTATTASETRTTGRRSRVFMPITVSDGPRSITRRSLRIANLLAGQLAARHLAGDVAAQQQQPHPHQREHHTHDTERRDEQPARDRRHLERER